ncbi:MAG: glycerol-3-phosphate dehydrogenase/oxidase [Flavobacteriales bacterium]|nr:glycerol-3-phosphate dehydrogenase/oxidase [Flavobacteriales bacterium]
MFSVLHRAETVSRLDSETFDLLVIGGGVTGAGIALDASQRGLSVALIEKQDFGAGTSSRSTKLIHGGLRYLKQFEFALVREVGLEREIVHRNAPHIVIPERMLLPIVKGGSLGRWSASVGLYVYDMLAGVRRKERRKMLTLNEAEEREPLLRKEGLVAGALYWEYRTDDARLVTELAKTAYSKGAVLINYCQLDNLTVVDSKVVGGAVTDLIAKQSFQISAKKTVNAAGPWVDRVRSLAEEVNGKRLHLTKGVHLVFSHERLPIRQALYFDVEGGRMLFAIPRDGCTYVGTTDTNYTDDLERPQVTRSDVDYVLAAINRIFDIRPLTEDDIRSTWAGLRPLIHEDGKSPSELSRKDEIFVSRQGLISIAGGKLTGFRKMAERTVDLCLHRMEEEGGRAFIPCSTHDLTLSGGEVRNAPSFLQSLPEDTVNYFGKTLLSQLYHRYGGNAAGIAQAAIMREGPPATALILEELDYGVNHEMVTDLSDFLIRRTGRLYFAKAEADLHAERLNRDLADLLGWDSDRAQQSIDTYRKESEEVVTFV